MDEAWGRWTQAKTQSRRTLEAFRRAATAVPGVYCVCDALVAATKMLPTAYYCPLGRNGWIVPYKVCGAPVGADQNRSGRLAGMAHPDEADLLTTTDAHLGTRHAG